MTDELKLCTWSYSRQSYAIAIHDGDDLSIGNVYCSPGTAVASEDITTIVSKIIPGNCISFTDDIYVEDDDSVNMLLKKIAYMSNYRTDYLYLWAGEPAVNMRFDLIYNDRQPRPFKYEKNPTSLERSQGFRETLRSFSDWTNGTKVTTVDFENSILSSYTYENTISETTDQVNIIHCMPMKAYVKRLKKELTKEQQYLIKTYYVAFNQKQEVSTEYPPDDATFKQLKLEVKKKNTAIRAIESLSLNRNIESNATDIEFYDCGILEAVIRINYKENNDEFVDLEKVFRLFPLSAEVPFTRLKSEVDTNYMIFKDSTNSKSPDYINKTIIQDWIDPKLSKLLDKDKTYSVSNYVRDTIGKGLSFKIFNYESQGQKKYMTINIYKNGKIELKCFWDEEFGNETNPGGKHRNLKEAIVKAHRFIDQLNIFDYNIPGKSKTKISLPDITAEQFKNDSNTQIAFLNTISVFDFKEQFDYVAFSNFLTQFTPYIHVDKIDTAPQSIAKSIEVRYIRLNNYVYLKNMHRFIENFKVSHPDMDLETREELLNTISTTFQLSLDDAEAQIIEYETKYEHKKKSRQAANKDDYILLNRDSAVQSGIDIKIITKAVNTMHKCLTLGIKYELLGAVYHFIRNAVYYFKHYETLKQMKFPTEINYLAAMRDVESLKSGKKAAQSAQALRASSAAPSLTASTLPVEFGNNEGSDEQIIEYGDDDDDEGDQKLSTSTDETIKTQQTKSPAKSGDSTEKTEKTQKEIKKKQATAHSTIVSLLDLLKANVKEAYSGDVANKDTPLGKLAANNSVQYSSACQASASRQPLVISVELKLEIEKYLSSKIDELKTQLQNEKDLDKKTRVKKILYEHLIHKLTLDRGMEYKPAAAKTSFFYFCPLSWNLSSGVTSENAFPPFSENNDNYTYMTSKAKFSKKYKSMSSWDDILEELIKLDEKSLSTPHNSYIGVIANSKEFDVCQLCCYANKPKGVDVEKIENCRMGRVKTTIDITKTSALSSVTYIKAEGKFIEEDRFAFIPEKLNRIFNLTDEGRVTMGGNNITDKFDYYLRKGVKKGTFLSAVNTVAPKIKNIVEYLSEVISMNKEDIYLSLKKGAINQLFKPINLEKRENAQLDQTISIARFIEFLQENPDTNEDFLWDLVSKPGVLLPNGLNLLICEIEFTNVKSSDVERGLIKCPLGFEVNELFNVNRPSLIIYKYKDTYEVICHVKGAEKHIETNVLFEAGHPIVTEIVTHITTKCMTTDNLKAYEKLKRHNSHIEKSSMVNKTLSQYMLEDIPDLSTVLKRLEGIDRAFYFEKKVEKRDYIQILDSHDKVTYLKITESIWLPVKPSGIFKDIKISHIDFMTTFPLLQNMIIICEQLAKFENFKGYNPYAFMLDPGKDLNDPNDDSIIGLILSNGLICYTDPMTMRQYKNANKMLDIRNPTITKENYTVNIDEFLFNMPELWYDDYMQAEQQLSKPRDKTVDMSKIYTVRSNFENESYQRLRYELSRLMIGEFKEQSTALKEILSTYNLEKSSKPDSLTKIRKTISEILIEILSPYVITESDIAEISDIVDFIGPLDKGMDEISEIDMKHKYNYTITAIRYACHDRNLDKWRDPNDIHCQKSKTEDIKLFINSKNIISGADNNFKNYIARITEEIIRIPLKRKELLDGHMTNINFNVSSLSSNAYLLGSENMIEGFKSMYETGIDYKERMKSHYDVSNPENYTEMDFIEDKKRQTGLDQNCIIDFVNLPEYWQKKFSSLVDWKIVDITGLSNCIYTELDRIISKFKGILVDTRQKIASIINDMDGNNDKPGWQLALDYYSLYFPEDYKTIKTKQAMLENIKNSKSTHHKLSNLDLSLISNGYGIKFIIITTPNEINKTGIVCLNTTQTQSTDIIILYLQGLNNYSIVKNVKTDKSVFKLSEIPHDIAKEWLDSCMNDNLETIEKSNKLFLPRVLPKLNLKPQRPPQVKAVDAEPQAKLPQVKAVDAEPQATDSQAKSSTEVQQRVKKIKLNLKPQLTAAQPKPPQSSEQQTSEQKGKLKIKIKKIDLR